MKSPLSPLKILTFSFSTAIFIIPSLPTPGKAQLKPGFQVSVKFPPASKVGAPPRTTGTGARKTPCGFSDFQNQQISETVDKNQVTLTALAPENNVVTTLASNPAVYIYVPKTIQKTAEFRLIDIEAEKVVYENTFPLVKSAGIMKVNVPKTVNLAPGNKYQWQFMVICNPNDREADEIIEGWIERTTLTSQQREKIQQLKSESVARAKLYAEYGVWNEALNTLADLRDRDRTAKVEWVELLNSVSLGEIAQNALFDSSSLAAVPQNQPKTGI